MQVTNTNHTNSFDRFLTVTPTMRPGENSPMQDAFSNYQADSPDVANKRSKRHAPPVLETRMKDVAISVRKLRRSVLGTLDDLAAKLSNYDVKEVRITGCYSLFKEYALQSANVAKEYLVSKGVDRDKVTTKGGQCATGLLREWEANFVKIDVYGEPKEAIVEQTIGPDEGGL